MLLPLVCESNFSPRMVFKNICQLDGFSLPLLGYCPFHNLDLILSQALKLIDELVDLAVGGVDLVLEGGFPAPGCSRLIHLKTPGTFCAADPNKDSSRPVSRSQLLKVNSRLDTSVPTTNQP